MDAPCTLQEASIFTKFAAVLPAANIFLCDDIVCVRVCLTCKKHKKPLKYDLYHS